MNTLILEAEVWLKWLCSVTVNSLEISASFDASKGLLLVS